MIISFQHKGLRLFYETESTKGIRADHAKRLKRSWALWIGLRFLPTLIFLVGGSIP